MDAAPPEAAAAPAAGPAAGGSKPAMPPMPILGPPPKPPSELPQFRLNASPQAPDSTEAPEPPRDEPAEPPPAPPKPPVPPMPIGGPPPVAPESPTAPPEPPAAPQSPPPAPPEPPAAPQSPPPAPPEPPPVAAAPPPVAPQPPPPPMPVGGPPPVKPETRSAPTKPPEPRPPLPPQPNPPSRPAEPPTTAMPTNGRVRLGGRQQGYQPAPAPTQPEPPAGPPPPEPPSRRERRGHRYLPDPESGETNPAGGPYFRVPLPGQDAPQINSPGRSPAAPAPQVQGGRSGGKRRAPSGPIPVRPPSPEPAPPPPTASAPLRESRPVPPVVAAPAPTPTEAPEPRPARQSAPEKPVPQRGWRRAVYKLTRINPGLSPDEKYEQELRARVRRKPRGSYQIGMLGLKGGVGKTTTTVTLGTMLAQVRGDRILVLDADPGCGNLAERAGRTSPSSIADLIADENLSHYNDVRAHTSVNAHNLEILPTAEYTTAQRGLSGDDLRFAVDTVSKFYNLVLADCGPGLFDPVTRGVLETASAIVIVTNVSLDSARQAESALEWLRHNGYQDLLSRVVVVINHVAVGETNVAEKKLVRQFQQLVQPDRVVLLPWDKHIATGTEIQLDQLDPAYRRRVLELAAALSDDFERAGRR
ncbi:hypothetical protein BST16_27630 [Mycobacterium asiaticum DSM 44297]|nr:MinD/ParA family protein [Mycobacterium asiaticum]ORA08152.1 hypothetical protein BST16_27630 [Mycobacterium asiaticum DSM 44297]